MDILNIRGIDKEKMIEEGISETRKELEDLTTDRTCFMYTSHLYNNLRKREVQAHIIDTSADLDMEYSHYFIIVPRDTESDYIVDLTYEQFGYDNIFDKMYKDGYQVLNKKEYNKYLSNIKNISKKR